MSSREGTRRAGAKPSARADLDAARTQRILDAARVGDGTMFGLARALGLELVTLRRYVAELAIGGTVVRLLGEVRARRLAS